MNHDAQRPRFRWLGHATVECTLPGGEVMLIDAWVRSNPACPPAAHELPRLDALLLTHAHDDHIGDAVELCRTHRPAKVVAAFELCHWLDRQGVENCVGMNLGGSVEVCGARVTMVRADHSSGLWNGKTWLDGGLAAGYVVRLPGGFTFYHSGDTALFSDMQLIGDVYRPTLAFLPIGDHYTMDPHQAARACRFLGVRTVIPIHFGTFPVLTGTPEELRAELADMGASCEVVTLRPGESY
jgi:L-ascorbate metabolism protein UlaG (beta-lactamase superfamily)